MKYTSPLHLLPEHNNVTLDAIGLKRWKQELLLQFDLHQSATITVKNLEYDKNSILEAFNLLKKSPKYHLRLYKDKSLLNFIEHEDTTLFDRPKDWINWIDETYLEWLRPLFGKQFGDLLYKCATTQNKRSIKVLKEIYDSGFVLPETWQDEAYQKTYAFLNERIKSAKKIIYEPSFTTGEKPVSLKPEIGEYLNEYYVDVMDILPDDFKGLRLNYGDFAHDLIQCAINENSRYFHFDKASRLIIKKAAKIDARINDDAYAKYLLKFIEIRERTGIQGFIMDIYWDIHKFNRTMNQ